MRTPAGRAELTPLEWAAGNVWGSVEGEGVAAAPASPTPREAIEQAVREALERPPCVVSFSGGLDSSAVLAVAAATARRHGLPDPVPVTLRFPGHPYAEESDWQELVIGHLGIQDWQRIEIHDELDFLGALGRDLLAELGVLWPANAHFHEPIFRAAPGGSVLTGVDGDGLFGGSRWRRAHQVISRSERPQARDLLRVGLAFSPRPLRRAVLTRRPIGGAPWLLPRARWEVERALADEDAAEPVRWDRRMRWFGTRRYLHVAAASLELLAHRHDVAVRHPLVDPRFLAALARHRGRVGYASRAHAVHDLFGDLLPPRLLMRRTKAEFGTAMWGPATRRFVEEWDGGSGIDATLVDAQALRSAWRGEHPPLPSVTLLQRAWLAQAPGGAAD
jgi:asparagine synthetase B (glutamine-hydrolysing)